MKTERALTCGMPLPLWSACTRECRCTVCICGGGYIVGVTTLAKGAPELSPELARTFGFPGGAAGAGAGAGAMFFGGSFEALVMSIGSNSSKVLST